jgi:hypothetical protein
MSSPVRLSEKTAAVWVGGTLLLAAGLAASCHPAFRPQDPAGGGSSVRFLEEPASANAVATEIGDLKSGDYFQDARPIEPLALPVYPRQAWGSATVALHITVTSTGRVSDVGPSLRAVSIPNRFDAEFQQAVRAALAQWRFHPAQTCHLDVTKNANGEPAYHETFRENVETSFDIVFTFTAAGRVNVTPAASAR